MKPSSSTFSSCLLSISTGCASFSFSYQGQDSRKAWNSLDTAECLSKAHKHSMQGIDCQWNRPLLRIPPPCSQSQQAVPLPPSPVTVRILEKLELLQILLNAFLKLTNIPCRGLTVNETVLFYVFLLLALNLNRLWLFFLLLLSQSEF